MEKFIQIHKDVGSNLSKDDNLTDDLEFEYPTRLDSYDDTITGAMLDTTRRRRKSARAKLLAQLEIFEGCETALKEILEEDYNEA